MGRTDRDGRRYNGLRELFYHGGIANDMKTVWYRRTVTTVQHGRVERGFVSANTGELVAGPETHTFVDLEAERSDFPAEIDAHRLDDGFHRERSAHFDKITVPLLSAGNWVPAWPFSWAAHWASRPSGSPTRPTSASPPNPVFAAAACPVQLDDDVVGYRVRTHERSNSIVAHAAWLTTAELARDVAVRTTEQLRLPEPVHRARQLSRRLRSEYERTAGAELYDGIHS